MCKKLVTLLASVVLLCGTALFADDFDWSKTWCNYGAGIEKGDKILAVDAGIPWTYFEAFNTGGFAIPEIILDFQVACPIWKLPFTFGGYGSFGFESYHYGNDVYSHILTSGGVSASYHVMMPPKQLDLYAGLKSGVRFNWSNFYSSGYTVSFDYGFNLGASWYFSDSFGLNLELGYPMNKFGMVFKF